MAKQLKPAAPISVWAVVVVGKRTEWILWPSVARTRKESWAAARAYLFSPEHVTKAEAERRSGRFRVERVTVALKAPKVPRG